MADSNCRPEVSETRRNEKLPSKLLLSYSYPIKKIACFQSKKETFTKIFYNKHLI